MRARYCVRCGETTSYSLFTNRDAWMCLWDNAVTTGLQADSAKMEEARVQGS